MGRRKPSKRARAGRQKSKPGARRQARRWTWLWQFLLIFSLLVAGYVLWTDRIVRARFEGSRWELPSRVFARPIELYEGLRLARGDLESALAEQGYRAVARVVGPGEYRRGGERLIVHIRAFRFWDGPQAAAVVTVGFDGDEIGQLTTAEAGSVGLLRLPPLEIARIYPRHREDRLLVRLPDVPQILIDALVAVEDRSFFRHRGLDPRAILRAAWVNISGGRISQGGSTLTQQLVKNFYLERERTFWRKTNEAVMALLLEAHYSKPAILEAYLNEIYLGQAGSRAIHGFGMAAWHYYGRPLEELDTPQLALLAGLAKGASHYNPRRHPERARERRNLVLDVMGQLDLLQADRIATLRAAPLAVSPAGRTAGAHPGFMDLVRRQLEQDYRDEDLRSAGLQIFTTLDPRHQHRAEQALTKQLTRLERRHGLAVGVLQGALIAVEPASGEVLALVSGRDPAFAGFNRALSARRQVGSLFKPAIYLAALHQPNRYSAATLLNDTAVEIPDPDGGLWTPNNYDGVAHGEVPLAIALIRSYNLAAINLGIDIGYSELQATLGALGVDRTVPPYPAVFLGALEFTPLEMAQMYQTLANGGYRAPLRAIRAVLDREGQPLTRYGLEMQQTVPDTEAFVLTYLLSKVISEGTARSALPALQRELPLAGKTGTTDELRDSWFAGYGSNLVSVVWLGRDDNRPAGLTGASGALQVWAEFMRGLARPLSRAAPVGIHWHTVDLTRAPGEACRNAQLVPFLRETPIAAAELCR